MPNWSTNIYAVKSSTKNVLGFVNEGLKNIGVEPMHNIKDAIEKLWEKNNVMTSTFRPIPETFHKVDTTNDKIGRNAIDWNTKEPLFCSDMEYEAYSKEYDEAVKHQKETYGVVGWYDYNCDVAFGCKWDSEIELESYIIDEEKGVTIIFMRGQTPWCYPDLWLDYIKKTFDVNVFLCSNEEGLLYNFFCEIDGDTIEGYHAGQEPSNLPNREDFEDDEEYQDAYFECLASSCNDCHFYDYVRNYEEPTFSLF